MLKATVTGRIWSTKKLGEVPAGSILEVQVDETVNANCSPSIRWDAATAKRSSWQPAPLPPSWFPGKAPPIDALIIGSIDEPSAPEKKK